MAKQKKSRDQHLQPAFLFDLDGTLIDSVYQHILAWSEALRVLDIELSNWFIHRHIGMSDSLMLNACMREAGRQLSKKQIEKIGRPPYQDIHEAGRRGAGPARRQSIAQTTGQVRGSLGDWNYQPA